MIYTTKTGEKYELLTGSRGGYYYIDNNNVKHYVKKNAKGIDKKTTPKKPAKKKFSFKEPVLSKYICYYEKYDENGEMIDDFKEWTEAYSEEDARSYFENEYSHNPNVKISQIIKD